jgi:hypothetical protein
VLGAYYWRTLMTYPLPPCYSLTHVTGAVAAASDALAQSGAGRMSGAAVRYPGSSSDRIAVARMIWMDVALMGLVRRGGAHMEEDWARQLGNIVRAATAMGVWGGILFGTCCKTGEELRALSRILILLGADLRWQCVG